MTFAQEDPSVPAEIVPDKRHCKFNIHWCSKGGHDRILARSVGLVDPKECLIGYIVGQYRHMWSAGSSEGWDRDG